VGIDTTQRCAPFFAHGKGAAGVKVCIHMTDASKATQQARGVV